MKSSYLYQIINVAGGMVMMVVMLRLFSSGQFLEWSLFTAIGGGTIQMEAALSAVCTRLLVRVLHSGGTAAFGAAARQCRRWYRVFAVSVFIGLLIAGGGYFHVAAVADLPGDWWLAWIVYASGYLFTYLLTFNTPLLVASERISVCGLINSASRTINIISSCVLMFAGAGVLGLAASFMFSATLGGAALHWAGRSVLAREEAPAPASTSPEQERLELFPVLSNFVFIVASYGLYRAGLLVDVGSRADVAVQADYGLALQVLSLIMTLSAVPISMLVAPLQRAILSSDRERIVREMARLAGYANLVFGCVFVALIAVGPSLFRWLHSRASLPPAGDLLMLGYGFFVELNLLLLVNVAIACRSHRYVRSYLISAVIGLTAGVLLRRHGLGLYQAFALVPALTQLCIATPLLFREVSGLTGVAAGSYLVASARFLGERLSSPRRLAVRRSPR